MESMEKFIRPTRYLDYKNPIVTKKTSEITASLDTPVQRAVSLFNFVRDSIKYSPYVDVFDENIYRSSTVIQLESCFCIPKAILLASMARCAGIPSRLGFADIRNRRVPENLLKILETDIFYGHGFTELFINERWIKATPAFDSSMCRSNGLRVVEFDGENDAILPDSDLQGNPHIEYLEFSRTCDDFPFQWIHDYFREKYGEVYKRAESALLE